MGKSLIEYSKIEWSPFSDNGSYPGDTNIQIGLMQRMANSLEKIEKPYQRLLFDVEYLTRRNKELNFEAARMAKRIAAYQGVIKRMKKQK